MIVISWNSGRIACRRVAYIRSHASNTFKGRRKTSTQSSSEKTPYESKATSSSNAGLTAPSMRSTSPSTSSTASSIGPTTAPSRAPNPGSSTVTRVSIWRRLGPFSKAISAYDRVQQRRPYLTQFCTSLFIYGCGDLCAQRLGGDDYSFARTLRNLTIGGISSIPAYRWFMFLHRHFNYTSVLLSLGVKVVVNQIVFAPVFNTYFFGMQSLLSGNSLPQVWERIAATVPISVLNSFKLWPIITAFNFTYVQPQYRSIFAGVVAIGWQSYLSWLNRRAELGLTTKLSIDPRPESLNASE